MAITIEGIAPAVVLIQAQHDVSPGLGLRQATGTEGIGVAVTHRVQACRGADPITLDSVEIEDAVTELRQREEGEEIRIALTDEDIGAGAAEERIAARTRPEPVDAVSAANRQNFSRPM